MRIFATDRFALPLPPHHPFPARKYALLRERVDALGLAGPGGCAEPEAASDAELALAHDPAYVARVRAGSLAPDELRRLGFPWSPELVERSVRSVGATLAACRAAVEDGVAASLSGGTHHAFRDRGEGYCVFNDAAVALKVLVAEGRIARGLVVDCDVHQGNGTAAMLAGDPHLFTFSIHGERNFPRVKERSDLDVALPDGAGDAEYLAALAPALALALERSRPDLALYLAGADPLAGDRFGRLALTKAGLAARDDLVLGRLRGAGVPVAVTMAGGYARDLADVVDVHAATLARTAAWGRVAHS